MQGLSCIPTGEYLVQWTYSPRLRRKTYRVVNVPNRSGILIHPANYAGVKELGLRCELLGCIALGTSIGQVNRQRCVVGSRAATTQFELDMNEEDFILQIQGSFEPLEV